MLVRKYKFRLDLCGFVALSGECALGKTDLGEREAEAQHVHITCAHFESL